MSGLLWFSGRFLLDGNTKFYILFVIPSGLPFYFSLGFALFNVSFDLLQFNLCPVFFYYFTLAGYFKFHMFLAFALDSYGPAGGRCLICLVV